ncbi:hemagglutinin repeat-containing protein [Xenorhabdus sp. PB30.3]|uniref:hemagglutinin repeat-containing protein n=1 Tax=Xenorhabdus sp. PB30.3 TaxID=2788941 RepID=UPI001E3003A3|nr:hemagglutinin repeat-containing protein [Xenorhabdus sp. PB30.3]MCC8381573.1 hemagglutinin repeat-containing protein [Xenorhabdus sp. PB30.3]
MNKLRYRVIFSKTRQMLIVVSELAKSHTMESTHRDIPVNAVSSRYVSLRPLILGVSLALGLVSQPVGATIMADNQAPGKEQPTVIATANGIPQVNIQTPNNDGVSRNQYRQFDVEQKGAILNNSTANTKTALAGHITGNPWLAKGEAKIILNEVNSRDPSKLNGFIEVAGQRAEVIVANPAGITCQGCGFINANKTTLAAGQAVLENGRLKGFDVKNGQIAVEGKGLNDEKSDHTRLIARAVKINAKLHAQNLTVTTGQNRTDAQGNVLQTAASDGNGKPEFSLDVAAIGGMYANKIKLVGTEKGVGVRNAGHLGAQAGDVLLNSNGKLINSGSITASGNITSQNKGSLVNQGEMAAGVDKNGKLTQPGRLTIDSRGQLTNGGTLAASENITLKNEGNWLNQGQVQAHELVVRSEGHLTNSGKLTASKDIKIDNQGDLANQGEMTANRDITLTVRDQLANQGKIRAGRHLSSQSTAIQNQADGQLAAGVDRDGNVTQPGTLTLKARKTAQLKGQIAAHDNVSVEAQDLSLEKSQTSARNLTLTSDTQLNLQDAKVHARQNLTLNAPEHIDNQRGDLSAELLTLTSRKLNNRQGKITQTGPEALVLNHQDGIDNQNGLLETDEALVIRTGSHWNNRGGTAKGGKQVNVSVQSIDNTKGQLRSGGDLILDSTGNVINQAGILAAQHNLHWQGGVNSLLNNDAGTLLSDGAMSLKGKTLLNRQQGTILSKQKLTLTTAESIDNQSGGMSGKQLQLTTRRLNNTRGKLLSQGRLQIEADQAIDSESGLLEADEELVIHTDGHWDNRGGRARGDKQVIVSAQSIDNTKGQLRSGGDLTLDSTRDVINQAGILAAQHNLRWQGGENGLLNNDAGTLLSDGALLLQGKNLLNRQQGLIRSQQALDLAIAGSVDNQSGEVGGKQLQLTTRRLNNTRGKLFSQGRLQIDADQAIDNEDGRFEAEETLAIHTDGHWNNRGGTAQGGNQVTVSAQNIDNRDGKLYSGGDLILDSTGDVINQAGILSAQRNLRWQGGVNSLLNNDAGTLFSDGAIALVGGQLTNRQEGLILSQQALDLTIAGRVDNQSGEMGGKQLQLTAQHLNNMQGKMLSQGPLQIETREAIDSEGGLFEADEELVIHTGGHWNNRGGTAQGGKQVIVSAQSVDNTAGKLRSGGDLTLDSTGDLINQAGILAAQHNLRWQGGVNSLLNNDAGTLLSDGAIALVGGQLTNRQQGLILSQQALDLTMAGRVDNQSGEMGGEQLQLTAQYLNNMQGKVLSQGRLQLEAREAINSEAGLFEAAEALTIHTDGHWNNRGGTAQGGKQVTVSAQSIDNTAGKLRSGGDLALDSTGDVINQAGTLTAQQRLQWLGGENGLLNNDAGTLLSGGVMLLQGKSLLNRQQGFVQSLQALSLDLTGDWDNQGGKLASVGRSTVNAQSLRNAKGDVQVLDALDMNFTRTLDNSHGHIFSKLMQFLRAEEMVNAGGWMGSQGGWSASGRRFDNRDGDILSQQATTLTVNTLDNQKGTLQSAGALMLQADKIDNRAGKISAQGMLDVAGTAKGTAAGLLQNRGGQLLAGDGLTVTVKNIDNQQNGLIYSQKWLHLVLSGSLDNRQGKLQSEGDMQIVAQSLLNKAGSMASQQALGLRILERLDNSQGAVRSSGNQQISAGRVDNLQGIFSSQGGINLAASRLDNQNGTLISQWDGVYRLNELNNPQGKVHSGGTLTLNSEQVNNQGGQLVSTGAMHLNSQQINNDGQGKITSQNALVVQTNRLNNHEGGLLQGTTHTDVIARELNNRAGRLQSAGSLTLSRLEVLNNQQGSLLANNTFNINTDAPSVLTLSNQGGTIQSGESLAINTRLLNNQGGTVLSQQSLALTVQQDYTHRLGDTLSSNGAVTFNIAGTLTNEADWRLPDSLTVNSTHFTNVKNLIGKALQLTTGILRNGGRLEADSMMLTSDRLDNTATVMGDDITVRSRVIDNYGRNAVIAATEALSLRASTHLKNRNGSLIYSSGSLYLGSDDLIENRGSRIEADKNAVVEAKRLDNLRTGLYIEREAEKSEYEWHRYHYNWRSYGSSVNTDHNTIAPVKQRLTFRNNAEAEMNRYGTLLNIDAAGKRAQVRVKDNEGQMRELWVNYLALTPGRGGSYDMTFYETRGHRQHEVPTPYHNTVWREHNRGYIEQWDPAKHINIADAPYVTDYNNFRERSVTGTRIRDKLVSKGIGAHILSGHNLVLNITNQLRNDASTISTNGNLSIKGDGKITNQGYSVNERRTEFISDHYDRDTRHWYPQFNHEETTAIDTVDSIITGQGNVSINGASLENTTVNQAQISRVAAAQEAITAERTQWERNPLSVEVDGGAWQTGDRQLTSGSRLATPDIPSLTPGGQRLTADIPPFTSGSQRLTSDIPPFTPGSPRLTPDSQPLTPSRRPLTPAERILTDKQHLGSVATTLPNNGLFRQHPAPESRYLVVTDERFTNRSQFISSDYMLQQMGYNHDRIHKRLGDGFYEQRLVREQLLQLTGRPSVRGEDALEQYKSLMKNGIKVAKDFQLVPGVALTPEQIAALQQDITWLVSETVDTDTGPQTVWVPKVYLANTTLRLAGDGAVIGGNTLQLSADNIQNAGNLFSNQALNIDAGQFRHQSGDIRADSISVQADSLSLITNLQDALRQATMSARDISLSGGDIGLQGAKLDALQNLSLHARNNLDITTARSRITGSIDVISGAMGNRTSSGIEEAGKRRARISGEWQQALGSTLNAGGNLSLTAERDLILKGSQAKADGLTRLQAGEDVKLLADTATTRTDLEANSRTSSVHNSRREDRLHLSTLGGNKNVTILAGKNFMAEGAQVESQSGGIGLSAQAVTIKDARQSVTDQDSESKRVGSTKSQRNMETVRDKSIGSTFSGRDGIVVVARESDIMVTGSTLHSEQGALALQAKKDMTLNSATERDYLYSEARSDKASVLSKQRRDAVQKDNVTRETGTLLSGDSIHLAAGNDLAVSGSAIAGDKDVTLQAGNNVDVTAATETQSHYRREEKKKRGLLSSGGIGFTVGSQSTRHQSNENGTTQSQSASTVGSNRGDVNITAGNRAHISGSNLVAGQDLSITGNNVHIDPGYDKRTREETFESTQSGLTLSLSGTVGSALNTGVSAAQQARKASEGRLKTLLDTQAALSGAQALQAWQLSEAQSAKAAAINQVGGQAEKPTDVIGGQLSLGSQSSKSATRHEQTVTQGSQLNAGRDIRITATGEKEKPGSGGDIQVQGSELNAGRDISLSAKRNMTLTSGQNTETLRGQNSSKGGNIGVGLTVGQGGTGLKFSAGGNAGKGHENGDKLTHTETQITAGGQVTLNAGQDAGLKGAQVRGEKVTANIGGNLHLQSEQDTDNYGSKQQNARIGASVTYGVPGGSFSAHASQEKMTSQYQSVNEQTGIFAGKGGFDLNVGKHTQLDGAVIASRADKGKNRLETGTLGFSDIQNKAAYQTGQQSAGISTGGAVGSQLVSNMASNMLSGTGNQDSKTSTTHAAVSEGAIVVHDSSKQKQDVSQLSRDPANAANSLNPIFDKAQEQQRLTQAEAIANIGTQVLDTYNTQEAITATNKATTALKNPQRQQYWKEKAKAQLDQENVKATPDALADRAYQLAYHEAIKAQGVDIGGNRRQAVTAVVSALQGLAGGDIKAAIAAGAAPSLANSVKAATDGNQATNLLAHAILGGVIAEMKGGSTIAGATGAVGGELAASAIAQALYPGKASSELTPDEKEKISNLSTLAGGIAAGLTTDSTAGGVEGAQSAKNAVENNFLSVNDLDRFAQQARNCEGDSCQKVIREMVDTNIRQNQEMMAFCNSNPDQCAQKYGYLVEQWDVFERTIRNMDRDGTLPDEFKNYLPAVNTLGQAATGKVGELGWTKRFEAMGMSKETAAAMAMTLPVVMEGTKGPKSSPTTKGNSGAVVNTEKAALERIGQNNQGTTNLGDKSANTVYHQQLIKNAENISTAKPGQQVAVPRDLNEQTLWKQVESNPLEGSKLLGMNKDPRFPTAAGFQKMEAKHRLPDGQTITIHYQYNSNTGKAYDMKITTPQRIQQDPKKVIDSIKDNVK